jgi:hypothetical protein
MLWNSALFGNVTLVFPSAKFRAIAIVAFSLALSGLSAGAEQQSAPPLDRAYSFLFAMMDRYQQGSTLRVVQSFVPTQTFSNGDVSYTYDDAVMIDALLQRGRSEDLRRAAVLGDSLAYAQAHDPFNDGRVRNAYHAKLFIKTDGTPNFADAGSDAGDLAWTGIALVQLYHATSRQSYLAAAVSIARFVQANAYDTRGAGGYTGGITAGQKRIKYKSTEHNLDLYGLFSMLAEATGDSNWTSNARHALNLVKAMWDARGRHFYIGTGNDGVTINRSDPTPEDVQTWSFLSTGLARYQSSIDWALRNLSALHSSFSGLSYEVKDRTGVWFEGTGHAAAALLARDLFGDSAKAAGLLKDIEIGQAKAPNGDGNGIDAASKDGLKTGDGGDEYYAALHIGATSWYCIAKQVAIRSSSSAQKVSEI